mgnify:CR=1 FL=1
MAACNAARSIDNWRRPMSAPANDSRGASTDPYSVRVNSLALPVSAPDRTWFSVGRNLWPGPSRMPPARSASSVAAASHAVRRVSLDLRGLPPTPEEVDEFVHDERPDAYDSWQAPASNADNWMATKTVADAVQYLRHVRPNLLFVHIGEPDYAGHTTGWMSVFYGWATRRADGAVETLLEAADDAFGAGNYTVILTADHGGHEHNHGSESIEDVRIPWIAWGQGVAPGSRPAGVRTMDTAATALWLLGVPYPAHWAGHAVRGAFVPAPAATVAAEAAAGA